METSGKILTIDKLNPINNRIEKDNLVKFLSDFDHTFMDRTRPKGPDYLVIDNFVQFFKMDKADLLNATN